MGCFGSKLAKDFEPLREARATIPSAPPRPEEAVVQAPPPSLSRQSSRTSSRRESTSHREMSSLEPAPRKRVSSTPEQAGPVKPPMPQDRRSRAQSTVAPRSQRSDGSRPLVPELPNVRARVITMSSPGRSLTSTVQHMLPNNLKFRILVIGKRRSGKSSLINATFGVDLSAAQETWTPKRDINLGIRPKDNSHLIVHEFSAFEPGDAQSLQSIWDFISYRTDPNRPAAERLHAVWICVPAPDVVNGSIGEGVGNVLAMRGVPVIVAFTKFDTVVPPAGNRTKALTQCEQSCRDLFRGEPRDTPVEAVSVNPQYRDLIGNLVVTTDRLITGSRAVPASSTRMSTQWGKPRTTPVPLAWSVAVRVSYDFSIQASIEVGRSRYWCNLWSNLNFDDQKLKDCVDIIHVDVVEIWNLNDSNKHLLSATFKGRMSRIVKDLAGPASDTPTPIPDLRRSGDEFADWGNKIYQGSRENVQCVMGYIVDLTVILHGIFFLATDRVSAQNVLSVMDRHVKSKRRDMIHGDIRSFVTEMFGIRFSVKERDLVLEKTIDLIKQYSIPF